MKKTYFLANLSLIALLFSACGGGGGDASYDSGNTKIPVINCNNQTPVFTTIEEKDLLVKEESSTEVTIIHSTNGEKKVCVLLGSAHLLREN